MSYLYSVCVGKDFSQDGKVQLSRIAEALAEGFGEFVRFFVLACDVSISVELLGERGGPILRSISEVEVRGEILTEWKLIAFKAKSSGIAEMLLSVPEMILPG